MSPFLVYLMFQIDSISSLLIIVGSLCVAALLPLGFAAFRTADFSWDDKDAIAAHNVTGKKWMKKCVALAACCLVTAAFMPSTKTIAAMIVLPKITSPQAIDTMSKESRDIYDLAKKALTKLADDKPAEEAHKQ